MAYTTGKQVPEKDNFTAFNRLTIDSENAYELDDTNYSAIRTATMDRESIYNDASAAARNTATMKSIYTDAAAAARNTATMENSYTDAAAAARNTGSKNSKGEVATTKSKKWKCLTATSFIIIMLMLITGCLVLLFLELANLKSELSSFKQTLPSERAQQLNTSIEGSFSTIEDRFEDIVKLQSNSMQQLNISVQERLQDAVNQLSEQIYENFSTIDDQLAEIDLRIQQINVSGQVQEDTVNQLNISTRLTELEDTENLQNNKIQQINASLAGLHPSFPATSCAALPPSSPSGYYWVRASNGSAVRVYCDMTRSCGGVTGGWVRVAELDMTNSSHQCPSGLGQRTDSNTRTCVRDSNSPGCSSVTFSSVTLEYSRVCGKIIAYQFASPDAFAPTGRPSNPSINTYYVDGVSLTHGSPRQHIWTLAAAHNEDNGLHLNCPCTNNNTASQATQPPAFVRNDYFCDTGSSTLSTTTNFNADDPLWDGAGCGSLNTCCSFNNPPWFYRQLPQPTIDDIEMRVCRDEDASNEDIAIEMVEIYIQ